MSFCTDCSVSDYFKNCAECISLNECTKCADGYLLVNKKCTQ